MKAKFERLAGTEGCFDEEGKPLPSFRASDASRAQFFAEEKRPVSPTPYDRPIVGWFDLAEK